MLLRKACSREDVHVLQRCMHLRLQWLERMRQAGSVLLLLLLGVCWRNAIRRASG